MRKSVLVSTAIRHFVVVAIVVMSLLSSPGILGAKGFEPTGQSSQPNSEELAEKARQAMRVSRDRLAWMKRFRIEANVRYVQKDNGRVEERSTLVSDGTRLFHLHESTLLDKPIEFSGRSLTTFGLSTGESFLGGTCVTGKPMITGGASKIRRDENVWALRERTCLKLEGYRAGNEGQTVIELLLNAKHLDVKEEQIGETDCFRISTKDEWGATTAWLEAGGSHRLLQWESFKERGNRFSGSRHGEHRDTSRFEVNGERVTDIQYQDFDGVPIAVRGQLLHIDTLNGGKPEYIASDIKRVSIDLAPDFSKRDLFQPLFAEGARISDWDSSDRDSHFRWRSGKLVAAGNETTR